jgi:hypothetical protein
VDNIRHENLESASMAASAEAPWNPLLGMMGPPRPRRVLHLCTNGTQACLGAIGQDVPGFAVALTEEDGIRCVRWAEATVFGTVDRRVSAPETVLVEGLVIDTLQAGEKDVWLSCTIPAVLRDLTRRAEKAGHSVRIHDEGCSSMADPFSLFSTRRIRGGSPNGMTMSFCELDPMDHKPMKVGDVLHMAHEPSSGGGTQVGYVDEEGWLVGLHGLLPGVLDWEVAERLGEVHAVISYVSWGRSWRAGELRDMQFLIFDIPCDVDAVLADAKLPHGRGAARP